MGARFGESIEILVEHCNKWVKVLILGQIGSEVLFLSNKFKNITGMNENHEGLCN